jgi:hypothetical protein
MFNKLENGVVFVINAAEEEPDYYKYMLEELLSEYKSEKTNDPTIMS